MIRRDFKPDGPTASRLSRACGGAHRAMFSSLSRCSAADRLHRAWLISFSDLVGTLLSSIKIFSTRCPHPIQFVRTSQCASNAFTVRASAPPDSVSQWYCRLLHNLCVCLIEIRLWRGRFTAARSESRMQRMPDIDHASAMSRCLRASIAIDIRQGLRARLCRAPALPTQDFLLDLWLRVPLLLTFGKASLGITTSPCPEVLVAYVPCGVAVVTWAQSH